MISDKYGNKSPVSIRHLNPGQAGHLEFQRDPVYLKAVALVQGQLKLWSDPEFEKKYINTGDIVDQMKRCMMSVPLNIAEAFGKSGHHHDGRVGYKIQHLGHARGSMYEFMACLDIIEDFPVTDVELELIYEICEGLDLMMHDLNVQRGYEPSNKNADGVPKIISGEDFKLPSNHKVAGTFITK